MPQELAAAVNNEEVYMVLPDGSARPGTVSNPDIGFNTAFVLCGATFSFSGLIEIKSKDTDPFSEEGESGSIIYNSAHNIIGILLGTNYTKTRSYAVPFINGKTGITSVYQLNLTGGPPVQVEDAV